MLRYFVSVLVVFCAVGFALTSAKSLPDGIEKCKENDPKLNECIKDRTNIMIPKIAPGDLKKHIPSLTPFLFDKIETDIGAMHLKLTEGKIFGLDKCHVETFEYNKETGTMKLFGVAPEIVFKSEYTTSGKISILPIDGHGPFEMHIKNARITITINLENLSRDSKKPVHVASTGFDYTYGDITLSFENLFNGNKQLSDPVNKLINEEHETLNKEFKPFIVEVLNELAYSLVSPVLNGFHYSDLFA